MLTAMRDRCLGLSMLALVLFATPAAAQEPPPEYRDRIERAVEAFNAGRFEEARDLFREAHAIEPNARTLRGLGMVAYELADYAAALRYLDGALSARVRPLTEDQRTQVQELRNRARQALGRFRFELTPRGAVLRVDDTTPVFDDDGALVLPVGSHRITASARGHSSETIELEVIGREERTIRIDLRPMEGANVDVGGEPVEIDDDGSSGTGIALVAVSTGLLSATIGTAIWWRLSQNNYDKCERYIMEAEGVPGAMSCDNLSTIELERNAAAGLTIAGAALTITTGIIGAALLLSEDSSEETPIASLRCSVGPLGGQCAGTF